MSNTNILDVDIFAIGPDIELGEELEVSIGDEVLNAAEDGEDLLSLDDMDFEILDDTDFIIDDSRDTSLQEEDNIDYSQLIMNLKPSIEKSQRTMQDSIISLKTEFDIPLQRSDFKLFNEVQFHVYYEFMSDTIKDCLRNNSPLPECDALFEEFVKVCEESGWYFGLYKEEFVRSFTENYNCILNEIDSYRAEDQKQRGSLFNQEDIEDIDFTYQSIRAITEFPSLCAKQISSLDNIDLEADIFRVVKSYNISLFLSNKIITIGDMVEFVQDTLKSVEVHDYLLNKLHANTSMVSLEEIIRLLHVDNLNNSDFVLEDVDVDKLFFEMLNRLRSNSSDTFALVIIAVLFIIIYGTPTRSINTQADRLTDFISAYMYSSKILREIPNYKTPAFITNLTFSGDSVFVGCSKGEDSYQLTDPFYLIAGSFNSMVKAPLAIMCRCEKRNCCGCLFPNNLFVSQMIDWTDSGILDSKKQNQSIRFKTYLSPKELSKMSISVNLNDTEQKRYNVSQDTEKWFLSFQEYIQRFKFVDDGFEPKVLRYEYSGKVTEDMQVPGMLPGDHVEISLSGIEQLHSNGSNSFSLLRFELNGMKIHVGDIATDAERLFVSYFMDGSFEKQYVELPLEASKTIVELQESVQDNQDDLSVLPQVTTGTRNLSEVMESYERYRHIAQVLSDLTGNAFDLLEEKSKSYLLGSYGYILEFPLIRERILSYVLHSYKEWLLDAGYIEDVVNFAGIKSLLAAISGEQNTLSSCDSGNDVTKDMVNEILQLMADKIDLSDIIDRWHELDVNLLANTISNIEYDESNDFDSIYTDLLLIPECRDFILTLQYKILISIICFDKHTRMSILFGSIPFLAKTFKNKNTNDFLGIQAKIRKEFKQFRKLPVLQTVLNVFSVRIATSVEDVSLLRTFTLTRNIFGIFNTLLSLGRRDLVELLLIESKADPSLTADYFGYLQNEQTFDPAAYHINVTNMYTTCREHLMSFVYDGIKQDILSNDEINSVFAYDLLINLYDVLHIDFDIDMCSVLEDLEASYIPSILLSYCCVTGEAIYDVNENKNRVVIFSEKPECFPAMESMPTNIKLKDILFIAGGD